MATIDADPDVLSREAPHSDHLAHERRLQQSLCALQARGWEQRLQPLAQHMAAQHLVCARGHAGARLRHLDLEVLREALSRLLSQDDDDGYLISQLVVEGMEPALVAEPGLRQHQRTCAAHGAHEVPQEDAGVATERRVLAALYEAGRRELP